MSDPQNAPEALPTRPERRFEGRRKFIGIILIVIILGFGFTICRMLTNPIGGVDQIGGSRPATMIPSPIRPTITVQMIVAATLTPTPTSGPTPRPTPRSLLAQESTATPSLVCWATEDIQLDDKTLIPRDAMLRITGWTAARGGMVELQNLWIAESKVWCNGDVRQYERAFVLVPTKAKPNVGDAPRIVYVPVTTTPSPNVPMATATPSSGIYPDAVNGCWRINVNYVREIWVNGQGVSNGMYCAVNEFKVIINK